MNSLAPEMLTTIKKYPDIFEQFLKLFLSELGLDNSRMADGVISLIKGEI